MTELSLQEAGALAPLVSAEDAAARVATGAVLIDVRSAAGRASAGDLAGATVVGKDEVDQRFSLDSADRLPAIESADTPVIIVCGSVRGSGPVAARLLELGFTDVVHVEGGFPALNEVASVATPSGG